MNSTQVYIYRQKQKLRKKKANDRPHIEFCVNSETLDGDQITALLQIRPDSMEEIAGRRIAGRQVAADSTMWSLESQHHLNSPYPNAHIDWLLNNLFGKLPSIRRVQKQADTHLFIQLFCEMPSGSTWLFLNPELLQRLAQLRIKFSIYFTSQAGEIEV